MDESEVERLRRTICRSFNSSPHKKKYWLALLQMRVESDRVRLAAEQPGSQASPGRTGTPAD
jgi:hypothetical protein